ncbi:MAG: TonB-dependent receptor [Steroidobacteraceae bacterium]
MHYKYARPLTALTASLAVFALAGTTHAQGSGDDSFALEEVVVTARKTSEQLIDVPLAITAFTAEAIEQRGISNLDDVAAFTPGLTFSNLIGEFLPAPVIRGVAPIDVFGELNTAIFFDGVYVSGREGINFSQLDLERIEVVKGPQAALYGRNAFSGAINYVSAKPTDEFQAKTQVTFGNDGKQLAKVTVSGPIIEGALRGRASVLHDEWDGSYENAWGGPGPGSDIGGYRYRTFNGALIWNTDDSFEAELGLYVSNDQIDNSALSAVVANCEDRRVAAQQLPTPPAMLPSSRLLNYCGELPAVDENSLIALPTATGEDRDLTRAHLKFRWNLAGGELTALTSYSKVQQSFFVDGARGDGENTILTYLTPPFTTIPGLGAVSSTRAQFRTGLLQIGGGDQTEEFSQEIRFSSDREKALRYSFGAYYYSTDREAGEDGVIATRPLPSNFGSFCLACTFVGAGWVDFAAGAGDAAFLEWFTDPAGGSTFGGVFLSDAEAPSVFGQLEYDFTDRLTGSVEARYTDEERSFRNTQTGSSGKDKWGLTSWRTSLRFKPQENITFFGGIAHSEKAGDFDPTTVQLVSNPGVNVTLPGSFDSEELMSYELGVKASLLDRRVSIEFDVYYLDWKDIVIPQVVSQINGQDIVTPTGINVNGGDATIKGAEFAITARPIRGLDLNLAASWADPKYETAQVQSFIEFPTYSPDGDVSGNQILRTSKFQATAGARWSQPLRGDTDWFIRGDVSYRDKQFADASNQTIVPSSTNLNASIGVTNDRWSLELWGRNLTDEDAPTGAFRDVYFSNTLPNGTNAGGTFFPFRYTVSHPRRLTYGLTWKMNF